MNRDVLTTFSIKSRLDVYGLGKEFTKFTDALERFAQLVAKHEREACEHICVENGALGLAAAIRARGEK